jgi:hypothetical protein
MGVVLFEMEMNRRRAIRLYGGPAGISLENNIAGRSYVEKFQGKGGAPW